MAFGTTSSARHAGGRGFESRRSRSNNGSVSRALGVRAVDELSASSSGVAPANSKLGSGTVDCPASATGRCQIYVRTRTAVGSPPKCSVDCCGWWILGQGQQVESGVLSPVPGLERALRRSQSRDSAPDPAGSRQSGKTDRRRRAGSWTRAVGFVLAACATRSGGSLASVLTAHVPRSFCH
jgi:hypothetical protein